MTATEGRNINLSVYLLVGQKPSKQIDIWIGTPLSRGR